MEQETRVEGLVDYDGARQLLGGVSWQTIYRLHKSGELEPVRIGRRVLFRRGDIERLTQRRSISTQEPERAA